MSLTPLNHDHVYKKPEVILSFPQSLFVDGAIPDKDTLYKNAMWTTRDFANANQDLLRQAASYVVLYRKVGGDLQIAMYFREKNADSRLAGKRSIGYGGHPELKDIYRDDENDIRAVISNSAEREVNEEANLIENDVAFVPELYAGDLIIHTDTPIDRCHVGFMYFAPIPTGVTVSDTDSDTDNFAGWMSVEELESLATEGLLEFWSVTCLNRMKDMAAYGRLPFED